MALAALLWSLVRKRPPAPIWRAGRDSATAHGLAEVRLLRWRARLEEKVAPVDPVTAAFLSVKIKESAEPEMGEGVALVLTSGVVIRVPVGTPPTWVARLVQALEHAPC